MFFYLLIAIFVLCYQQYRALLYMYTSLFLWYLFLDLDFCELLFFLVMFNDVKLLPLYKVIFVVYSRAVPIDVNEWARIEIIRLVVKGPNSNSTPFMFPCATESLYHNSLRRDTV